ILPALAALHNFIVKLDPSDTDSYRDALDPQPGQYPANERDFGALSTTVPTRQEKKKATDRQDRIAEDMWVDYQQLLRDRGQI
ncbi:hypothetical protein C8J56DRAFT_770590, partial [Mycena floridula]